MIKIDCLNIFKILDNNSPLEHAAVQDFQTVYDHDTFSKDDKMGDVEFDIRPYVEALKQDLEDILSGTTISRVQPCRTNCLSVECGELEIELNWIDLPGSKGV
ncbi:protein C2-DOMAIN ABA-RELATED 4-like [Hibiscus syriacus]|uniref:protein C2-DOMAIN ABA-RELATED 4-like n=1 Tax=Hibiscus syriacus TaxID=106335 RepID=UPI001924CC24|nr:protein C2-DOMAIN ABA-RELATED 4-like [Hibiscus syriacus]